MSESFIFRVKKDDMPNLLFTWLLLINQIIIQLSGIVYLTYVLFVFIGIRCVLKKRIRCEDLLLFIILPDKYLQLAGCIIFSIKVCIKDIDLFKKSIYRKETIYFFAFSLVVAIINRIVWGGSMINVLFQIILYFCFFVLFALAVNKKYEFSNTVLFHIFFMEVITGIIQIIITRETGDAVKGTLFSAHWYGVFILAFGYWFIKSRKRLWSKQNIFILFVVAAMLFLADAKHIYVCFGMALVADIILRKLRIKRRFLFVALGISAVILLFPLLCEILKETFVGKNLLFRVYIENHNYNLKYLYIKRMVDNMGILNGLFGFGLGQYGSQVCLTMAKGLIYPWQQGNEMFMIASEPYRAAVTGLMSRWYVEEGIGISSMVLGYPLVSIVGLIAENGVIGIILLFRVFEKIAGKYENSVLLITLLLLLLFDTYFEIPCVTVTLILFWGMQVKNESNSSEKITKEVLS